MTKREQPEVTKIAVVDIETLGKGVGSKIASIGCAILDVKTLQIGKAFYEVIETKDQHTRYAEADTVEFWLTQAVESPDAFNELFKKSSKPKVSLENALKDLSAWLKSEFNGEPINMFGNGPEFDNVILNDAYEQLGIDLPWSHWCNQSVRTMLLMYRLVNGNQQPDIKFEGVKHHALFDAVHEAKIIAETLRFVRDGIESVKTIDDIESLRQRSDAWMAVSSELSKVMPGWIRGDKCALDLAVDAIKELAETNKQLSIRLTMFDKAIQQIANHVGACCGGVDVFDDKTPGYSHTAAEIIRKIDASKGYFIGTSPVLGDIYCEKTPSIIKPVLGENVSVTVSLSSESGKDNAKMNV
ncbi:3'-5' exoribonuclease [Vibrio phage Rostov 7]|nr:3'-5' exoribonuclease [Vibrio phage Rostov 7]